MLLILLYCFSAACKYDEVSPRGALPMWKQLVLDIIMPPVGTGIWVLASRSWAKAVQGGAVSQQTHRRQKRLAVILLMFSYVLMFGVTIYGSLR